MQTTSTKQPVTLTVDESELLLRLLSDFAASEWNHARTTKSAAIRTHCQTRGRQASDLALEAAIIRRMYQRIESERETTCYQLPDGRIVPVYSDVARGASVIDYTLANGQITQAVIVRELTRG